MYKQPRANPPPNLSPTMAPLVLPSIAFKVVRLREATPLHLTVFHWVLFRKEMGAVATAAPGAATAAGGAAPRVVRVIPPALLRHRHVQ